MLLPAGVLAADPTTQPAPAPSAAEAVQAAPPAPEQSVAPGKVLVLPFEIVGGKSEDSWIGRSIQQSIMTDLMITAPGQVISATSPASDAAAASDLGQKLGAKFVIYGQVHVNNGALRVTGTVVSALDGAAVAPLKVTGSTANLFAMEDGLGAEARQALGGNIPSTPAIQITSAQPPSAQPMIQASGPVQVYSPASTIPYGVDSGAYEAPAYPVSPYVGDDLGTYSSDGYPSYGYGATVYISPCYGSAYCGGYSYGGRWGRGYGGLGGQFGGRTSGGSYGGGGHYIGGGRSGGGGHYGGAGHTGGMTGGGHAGGGHR